MRGRKSYELWILGRQTLEQYAQDSKVIDEIIGATENERPYLSLHDLLFTACIDAYNLGVISGKRAERAKKNRLKATR